MRHSTNPNWAGTSGNLVSSNFIGIAVNLTSPLPNSDGVEILGGATNNTIGGTTATNGNIISGNTDDGLVISDTGTTGNVVEGNSIGLDDTGTHRLGNGIDGVLIQNGTSQNTIGGTAPGTGNFISANQSDGIEISGSSSNLIEGNFIGTDSTGTVAEDGAGTVPLPLGNSNDGVAIDGKSTGNTVGGTAAGALNVISGNLARGVEITGAGTTGNLVQGNRIGTDVTGTKDQGTIMVLVGTSNTDGFPVPVYASETFGLGNGGGVAIDGGATANTVGGTSTGALNVISGNNGDGVYVSDPGTSSNTIKYNFIGTDVTGENPVPNILDGVHMQSGASYTGVYNDLISANGNDGVVVTGGNTNNNSVNGDWIGLDATGARAVEKPGVSFSSYAGVVISDGAYNTYVGGDTISGNVNGVVITGGATSNWIVYDQIGTGADGTTNVGNFGSGVALDGVTNNTVNNDLLVYNGSARILFENGANTGNNTLANDTFTITVNGVTHGNTYGPTLIA